MFYYIKEKLGSKSFNNIEVLFIIVISILIVLGLHIGIGKATASQCPTLKSLKKKEIAIQAIISEQEQLENKQEALNNVCKVCQQN
jgi:hypothetical protein